MIDASRAINSKLRLGGSVWVRALTNSANTGPFDRSFQDYRANAQICPWNKIDLFAGYHIKMPTSQPLLWCQPLSTI